MKYILTEWSLVYQSERDIHTFGYEKVGLYVVQQLKPLTVMLECLESSPWSYMVEWGCRVKNECHPPKVDLWSP